MVVAFEVIEHLEDWRGFLQEARRTLAAAGQFIVSTPNKLYYSESRQRAGPNPFHVHEFEFEEFRAELGQVFPHVSLFLENHAEGVVFQPASSSNGENAADVRVDDARCEPTESHFFLAVCALRPQTGAPTFVYVPRVANVLRERERHIGLLEREVETKNQWLEKTTSDLAQLNRDYQFMLEQHREQMDERARWAERLNRELEESAARVGQLQLELEAEQSAARAVAEGYQAKVQELDAVNVEKTRWALETEDRLGTELQQRCQELAQCVELLHQAEQTAEERRVWGERLQAQAHQLERQVILMRESRWVKLGRKFGLGPDLRNS
jgi:hypothetical protein